MTAISWWRRLTPRHLILLVPWVGVVRGVASPIQDNSFLWHVRAGTLQLNLGHVLLTDPFSFTMQGEPWRSQSWLLELGYGLLERWTNALRWVPVMLIVVGVLTFLLVGLEVHRYARNLLVTGIVMALFTWLGLAFQVPRPVLFSFLMLAMLMVVLDRGILWAIPVLLWVWASVHGSWALGLGYVVLEALASRRSLKPVVRTLAVSLLAVSVTAHGLGVWEILWAFLRNRDALRFISEWAIPNLLSIPNLPYALVVGALLFATTKGGIEPRNLWLIVPFLLFGLTSARSLFPAAIVLVPWTARVSGGSDLGGQVQPSRREAVANAILALFILTIPLAVFPNERGTVSRQVFPVEASRYLSDGNVWADDVAGGYLIYAFGPDRLVYIDDRAELYGATFMREFIQVRDGDPIWSDVFKDRGIQQVLVHRDSGIARALNSAQWGTRYEDSVWGLWVKPGTE